MTLYIYMYTSHPIPSFSMFHNVATLVILTTYHPHRIPCIIYMYAHITTLYHTVSQSLFPCSESRTCDPNKSRYMFHLSSTFEPSWFNWPAFSLASCSSANCLRSGPLSWLGTAEGNFSMSPIISWSSSVMVGGAIDDDGRLNWDLTISMVGTGWTSELWAKLTKIWNSLLYQQIHRSIYVQCIAKLVLYM